MLACSAADAAEHQEGKQCHSSCVNHLDVTRLFGMDFLWLSGRSFGSTSPHLSLRVRLTCPPALSINACGETQCSIRVAILFRPSWSTSALRQRHLMAPCIWALRYLQLETASSAIKQMQSHPRNRDERDRALRWARPSPATQKRTRRGHGERAAESTEQDCGEEKGTGKNRAASCERFVCGRGRGCAGHHAGAAVAERRAAQTCIKAGAADAPADALRWRCEAVRQRARLRWLSPAATNGPMAA